MDFSGGHWGGYWRYFDAAWHIEMKVGSKVVIIEDNAIYSRILQEMIRRLGHQSMIYDDAENALYTISNSVVSLAVVDNFVRDKKAVEIVGAIRRGIRNSEIPVLIVTSGITEEEKDRLIRLRVESIVMKDQHSEVTGWLRKILE